MSGPDWFTMRWREGALELLDQRELPEREVYLRLERAEDVALAIEAMAVRGAPAIGCAAAFGVACAAQAARGAGIEDVREAVARACERLGRTRPTAVNLFWALGRMREAVDAALALPDATVEGVAERALARAEALHAEDLATCRAIGAHGVDLVPAGARVLTHCNAGGLATAGYGTALGLVRAAHERSGDVRVLADETRPFLQGARLTAWELARDGIPVEVVTDGAAAHLMQRGEVDLVVVGADRVARNGDTANKIGTYGLAVLAREHGLPFYVAASCASVDLDTASGEDIPIEERGREEVARIAGRSVVPEGVPVRHPAFDVTPARLITAIVTERGVAWPPLDESLPALCASPA